MATSLGAMAPIVGSGGSLDGSAAPDTARMRSAEADRDVARSLQARFAFLAEASRCLADSLDYDVTLATVAGLALPHLGAWCIVDVIERGADDPLGAGPATAAPAAVDAESDGDTIRRLAVLHPDPERQALARELFERYPPARTDLVGAPRVMRTGRPEIVLDVPDGALEAEAMVLRRQGMMAVVLRFTEIDDNERQRLVRHVFDQLRASARNW